MSTETVFRRKIYQDMLKWKEERDGETALLIEGARRIGKSTIVEEFAKNEYDSYILIDFSKTSPEVNALFEDLSDLNYIFLRLQLNYNVDLKERKSLIVFDEVQNNPKARQAIKHLVKDHRYDYIETGSLISIRKNVQSIIIPSEETRISMHPMDFEEFRWALGDSVTIPLLRKVLAARQSLGDATHRKLMRDFRLYMLVGGMPQAVDKYIKTNNLSAVDTVKRDIIALYEEDLRKIDTSGKASSMYDAIPSQLSKNATRYSVSSVIPGEKADRVTDIVQMMEESRVANIAYHTNDPNVGLALTKDLQRYKMYASDTGLFITLAFKSKSFTDNVIYQKLLSDKLDANLGYVYDYIIYNFYSYLKDANADSMAWSSIQLSIERAEGQEWDSEETLMSAIWLIKAIGLLNLFSIATFKLTAEQMAKYASLAMAIPDAESILHKLEQFKIIRYAAYKQRLLLFEGTDVDLEAEIKKATGIVPKPISYIVDLEKYFVNRISPVKAHFYQHGTPRYFEYMIREEPVDIVPTGDTDGIIELIFSDKDSLKDVTAFSTDNDHALIFAYFNNADDIIEHLHRIKIYEYITEKVLIDKSDRVANQEIARLKAYEETLLVKAISTNLFEYTENVTWLFKGQHKDVHSLLDFNKLLSEVCDDVYSLTPVMNNELFNRHKLPGTISSARVKYLTALLNHYNEAELGFESAHSFVSIFLIALIELAEPAKLVMVDFKVVPTGK